MIIEINTILLILEAVKKQINEDNSGTIKHINSRTCKVNKYKYVSNVLESTFMINVFWGGYE